VTLMTGDRREHVEAPSRRRGRPPSADAERKILEATRELLAESGVHGLTIEGVAERTGCAKTTIYRRYRSKEDLALAVIVDMVEQMALTPDLSDTRAELVAFVSRSAKILGTTLMGRVMQGIVSELGADPALADAFRQRVVARRVAEVQGIIERGIERGELYPNTDYRLINELLFGPIYYRLLFSGAPLDGKLAERLVDAVLPAVTTKQKRSRSTSAGSRRRPAR
jgi:AcrR family transcriptional regulator